MQQKNPTKQHRHPWQYSVVFTIFLSRVCFPSSMQEDLEEGVPSQGSEGCCSPRAHPPSSKGILSEGDLLSFPCYRWEYTGTAILHPGCTRGCRCGGFQGFRCQTSHARLRGCTGRAEMIRTVLCRSHIRMEWSKNNFSHRH